MSEPIVRVSGLHKYFRRGSEQIDVLIDLSLDVPEGEYLALMGPSGSGKTTLLNLIAGLDQPSAGEIWVGDHLISDMSEAELARWRTRHVGFVFQFYHRQQVVELEDEADVARPPAREFCLAHIADQVIADPDFAGAGLIEAGDQVEQRRLARAGRPHQGEVLALGHVEAEVDQHVDLLAAAPEILVQATDPHDRFGHDDPLLPLAALQPLLSRKRQRWLLPRLLERDNDPHVRLEINPLLFRWDLAGVQL